MELLMIWTGLILSFLVLELSHPGLFYFLSISIGGAAALAALGCGANPEIQFAIFIAGALLACLVLKLIARRVQRKAPHYRSNIDALVGMQGVVVQQEGQFFVKLAHELWSVRPVAGLQLQEKMAVEVVAVAGNHVVVKLAHVVQQ